MNTLGIICPFLITPLFVLIYTSFLPPIYPSPVWFLPAVLNVIIIIAMFKVEEEIAKKERTVQYEPIDDEMTYCSK